MVSSLISPSSIASFTTWVNLPFKCHGACTTTRSSKSANSRRTSMRRAMDEWFESVGVRPRIMAEFEDMALLNACGHRGVGFFAVPDTVVREITTGQGVQMVGPMGKARERLYAISVERRVKHPAAVALVDNAGAALARGAFLGKRHLGRNEDEANACAIGESQVDARRSRT